MTTIAIADLTTGVITGSGVFDKLMVSAKAHLAEEFQNGRIKGPEYSTVYLSMLTAVMDQAVKFLLEKDKTAIEIDLITQQKANAVIEGQVLTATKCKLDAEFDVLVETRAKVAAEKNLLVQKKVTETAQVSNVGVDTNSVIGRQNNLYTTQANGFIRNAEQKATEIMVNTWNTRRMTDDNTDANLAGVGDGNIIKAVNKLLQGVGAT
jgi:hypothetical protein